MNIKYKKYKKQISINKNKILGTKSKVQRKNNINSIKIRKSSIVTDNNLYSIKVVDKVNKIVDTKVSNAENIKDRGAEYEKFADLSDNEIYQMENEKIARYLSKSYSTVEKGALNISEISEHEQLFEKYLSKKKNYDMVLGTRTDFMTSCHKVIGKQGNSVRLNSNIYDRKNKFENMNVFLSGYNKFVIDGKNSVRKIMGHQNISLGHFNVEALRVKDKKEITKAQQQHDYDEENDSQETINDTKTKTESNLKNIILAVNAGKYFSVRYDVKRKKILKIKAKKSDEEKVLREKKVKKTTADRLSEAIEKTNVLNNTISNASKLSSAENKDIEDILKITGSVGDKVERIVSEKKLQKQQKFLQNQNEKRLAKLEKKTDSVIEKKREINKLLYDKSLSKKDKAELERKLGIIKKKEKDSLISNDIKEKRINNLLKKNSAEIKDVDRLKKKLLNKNFNQKEKMRKLAQKQQLKAMSRAYIIKKMTEGQSDDTEFIMNLIKSKSVFVVGNIMRRFGKLLLKGIKKLIKLAAPAMAAMLPIIFMVMLLVAPFAALGGASDDEEQQQQEQVDEDGEYDGSVLILKGHMKDTVKNNPKVMKWKDYVKKAVKDNDMDDSWVDMVLCMMQQESGGGTTDLMQCGAMTQIESINTGVRILKQNCINVCIKKNVADLKMVLCCYNHGQSFADYIVKNYKSKYEVKASKKFCAEHLASYNATSSKKITVWGDPLYAAHVLQYYSFDSMVLQDDKDTDKSKWSDKDKKNVSSVKLTELTKYACKFIGNRYVYGGNDINNGIDCSGYVQYIFKHFGVKLPRTSTEQSKVGKKIDNIKNAKPGDLLFYANGKQVHHVAIYMGNNIIINASNKATYPAGGIKTQAADYQPIYCIRRVK